MRCILIAFMVLVSGLAQAGFYVGAQMGMDFSTYGETTDASGVDVDGLSVSGFSNGVYGGYRFSGDKYFWGLELNFTRSEAYFSDQYSYIQGGQVQKDQYKISMGDGHGAAFIWGGQLSGADLYGRLGWQMGKISFTDTEQNVTERKSFDLGGIRIGLGSELPLGEKLRLRLDWTYTPYQDETYSDFTVFEVKQSLFMVGLTFHI